MDARTLQKEIEEERARKKLPFSLVEQGDVRNLKRFVEEVKPKPNLNIKDVSGYPLIIHAAKRPTSSTLKILIAAKANISLQDDEGSTALIWAAQKGRVSSVQALLEAEAKLNTKNKYGRTALHYAAVSNHVDVINKLLEAKADLSVKDIYGYTPLHRATIQSHCEAAKALIEAKADVTARDNTGWTPFWVGLPYNNVDTFLKIRKLIKDATPKKPGWFRQFKSKLTLSKQRPDGYEKLSDERESFISKPGK